MYKNRGFVRDKRLLRYYLYGVDASGLKLWLRTHQTLPSPLLLASESARAMYISAVIFHISCAKYISLASLLLVR